MKILFVSSGTSKEGISTLVHNQGESLKKQGIDIQYFTIKSKGLFGYLLYIFKLRLFLINKPFDLIHAHYGLSGLVVFFAKHRKQKFIISFMGTDLLGKHNWKGEITLFGKLLIKVNQKLAEYADFVIVKSIEMSHRINCINKAIIPNGVNLNEYYEMDRSVALKELGWQPKLRHIFFMADPKRPEKNFGLARDAFKQLDQKRFQVHILKNIASSLILYYYNASDVCVLTSFYEGSPNVIKEAMACNCPIVSTRVGDVRELFGDTKGCYLTSFSKEDFMSKLNEALKFSEEKSHTAGRKRIMELNLISEPVAQNILSIYQQILRK